MKKKAGYKKVKIKNNKKRIRNAIISIGIILLLIMSIAVFFTIRSKNKSALTGNAISSGENPVKESEKDDKIPIEDNPIEKEPSKMTKKGGTTIAKIDG